MKTMNNDKAMTAFLGAIAESGERLDELKEFSDNHMNYDPETINWGHVGTAQSLLEKLTELTDQAYKRGEYAE